MMSNNSNKFKLLGSVIGLIINFIFYALNAIMLIKFYYKWFIITYSITNVLMIFLIVLLCGSIKTLFNTLNKCILLLVFVLAIIVTLISVFILNIEILSFIFLTTQFCAYMCYMSILIVNFNGNNK